MGIGILYQSILNLFLQFHTIQFNCITASVLFPSPKYRSVRSYREFLSFHRVCFKLSANSNSTSLFGKIFCLLLWYIFIKNYLFWNDNREEKALLHFSFFFFFFNLIFNFNLILLFITFTYTLITNFSLIFFSFCSIEYIF